MKRLASEVLRELEIRVARLEKQSAYKLPDGIQMTDFDRKPPKQIERNFGYDPMEMGMGSFSTLYTPGNAGAGKDFIPGYSEPSPTTVFVEEGDFIVVIGDDDKKKGTHKLIRRYIENFARAESSHISIERDKKYPMYRSGRFPFADYILTCAHRDLKEFRSLAQDLEGLGVEFTVDRSEARDLGF